MANKLRNRGWHSWWTPAWPTGRGGTTGGTMVALRKEVHAQRLGLSDLVDGWPSAGTFYTGVRIRMQQFAFCWVVLYLRPGHQFGEEALSQLAAVGDMLATTQWPWMVTADWNATPEELEASGAVNGWGGRVLVPRGVEATCTSGSARLLDYSVVSPSMYAVMAACGVADRAG